MIYFNVLIMHVYCKLHILFVLLLLIFIFAKYTTAYIILRSNKIIIYAKSFCVTLFCLN